MADCYANPSGLMHTHTTHLTGGEEFTVCHQALPCPGFEPPCGYCDRTGKRVNDPEALCNWCILDLEAAEDADG